MLTSILAAFHLDSPSSLKRAIAAGIGGLVLLISPVLAKYGVPTPSDTSLELFAGLVAVYLLQSGHNSAAQAKAAGVTAAAAVKSTGDAVAVLNSEPKP